MSRVAAIVPAAGLGTRMGGELPKQFLELEGVPLVVFTLRRLAACGAITDFIVATRADDVGALAERFAEETGPRKRGGQVAVAVKDRAGAIGLAQSVAESMMLEGRKVQVVRGGGTRQESVENALAEVPAEAEIILVHDAVRPFVTVQQVERLIAEARVRGAAILGIPAIDTVKEVKRTSLPEDMALISATTPRERIVLAQTPQVFQAGLLREAFANAAANEFHASDEAGLVERLGRDVFVVVGSERNIKITRPADMDLARFYLSQERAAAAGR